MDVAQIQALAAELATERAARAAADAALATRIDGATDARIDRLIGAIETQGNQIGELAMHASIWTGSPTDAHQATAAPCRRLAPLQGDQRPGPQETGTPRAAHQLLAVAPDPCGGAGS